MKNWIAILAIILSACQAPAPRSTPDTGAAAAEPPAADYAALAKSGGGIVYSLDASASKIRIHVFRGGKAAKAGHNHVLAAPKFQGHAYLHADDVRQSRFDLLLRVDELALDDPAWLEEAGESFSSKRSAADVEGTRRNLLGAKGLDAERFPFIQLRSQSVSGDWPILVAEVAVTIRDQTRVQPVMIRIKRSAEDMQAAGTLVMKQSDFGVEPFSVLGGLLAVQDYLAITFELKGLAAHFK